MPRFFVDLGAAFKTKTKIKITLLFCQIPKCARWGWVPSLADLSLIIGWPCNKLTDWLLFLVLSDTQNFLGTFYLLFKRNLNSIELKHLIDENCEKSCHSTHGPFCQLRRR